MSILEIDGDDIARLDDSNLRKLIGLLCEADYRLACLSTRGITWGGAQEAKDGGLDVVVRDDFPPPVNSFVRRPKTGFQVKKPDMPRSAILDEMCPEGILRNEIRALIQDAGAYVIVSASGSTTNAAIKNRLAAMREAVAKEEGHESLHVDFLDRGRVATWLRPRGKTEQLLSLVCGLQRVVPLTMKVGALDVHCSKLIISDFYAGRVSSAVQLGADLQT